MKRLFGLIGLTYLSALAVVFYFYNSILIIALISLSVITGAVFVFLKVKRQRKYSVIIASASVLCACLSFILYTNITYLPAVNKYSDKQLKISGYVCDEVQKNDSSCIYVIQTDTVNGKSEKLKIRLISYTDLKIGAFDRVTSTLYTYKYDSNTMISKGIFLKSYADDGFSIESTGEKQKTLYYYAVSARTAMKTALDALLPEDCSSLCKAVLLGDKQALSYDVRNDFLNTGTTFLIVVSGMHLSIVASFILFILRKITKSRIIICVSVCVTVFAFMALTGFTSSVVRSGVMLIITYCGTVLLRKADALNSMGVAALVLTIFNPYASGDIGLVLSFAATAGIIVWAPKINGYIVSKLNLKSKFTKSAAGMISASLSASVWIVPITAAAFGRVSPFVVIVSLLTESFVSVLIVCALLSSVFYLCPFISFLAYPFALAAGLVSKYIVFIERVFASIPYCSVNTDKIYFYIWMFVTLALVLIGFFIKNKAVYIKYSILISCIILIAGWAFFTVITSDTAKVNVWSVGSGVTASVESGGNITLLSCGGSLSKSEDFFDELDGNYTRIDNIIIPNEKNRYSSFQPQLVTQFDVSNILVYDNDSQNQQQLSSYDGQSRSTFGENVHFTIYLSSDITDEVFNADGITYQYVKRNSTSLLFVPRGADISALPERYRTANYLVIDKIPDNADLLNCKTVVFSGTIKEYEKNESYLRKLFNNVSNNVKSKVSITLN